MQELKPCPFCGESEDLIRIGERNYYYIFCMDCEAIGPPHGNEEDAVTAWNRRAIVLAAAEIGEAME